MNKLDRDKQHEESDKDYKKRLTEFYKSERAELKEHPHIRFHASNKVEDLADIIHKLHILSKPTYYLDGSPHCDSSKDRSENDLYLLVRYYINPKITFKFCSELLWEMYNFGYNANIGCGKFFHMHFCHTINRHCYTAVRLAMKVDEIRDYLKEKNLNLKVRKDL
jgi:hypothetical protein